MAASELTMRGLTLSPPFRFTTVEVGLYRGAYPTLKNFRFLRRLGLRTIVSLIPEAPTTDLRQFCAAEGITQHVFQAAQFTDAVTLSAGVVARVLELLINPDNLPLYLHCLDGINVTGQVVMCLRKLQNWNLSSMFTEFIRFTRDQEIEHDESQFVAGFREPVALPSTLVPWLWQGVHVTAHPTIPLRFPDGSAHPATGFARSKPRHADTRAITRHHAPPPGGPASPETRREAARHDWGAAAAARPLPPQAAPASAAVPVRAIMSRNFRALDVNVVGDGLLALDARGGGASDAEEEDMEDDY